MKTKLENGFLLIPKEILILTKINNKPFSFAEKAVYSYLLQWSSTSEEVFPSMKRMCVELGVGSRVSVAKYLEKLEHAGLLTIVKQKGKPSLYKVLSLEGKVLTNPKEKTLVSGTNEERRVVQQPAKVVLPDIPTISDFIPYPTSPWDCEFGEELPPF